VLFVLFRGLFPEPLPCVLLFFADPLDVRVALHVPIEQALQRKGLHADTANELIVAGGRVLVGSAG